MYEVLIQLRFSYTVSPALLQMPLLKYFFRIKNMTKETLFVRFEGKFKYGLTVTA